MQKRGLVVEEKGNEAIVLTPLGEFERVRLCRTATLGSEVFYGNGQVYPAALSLRSRWLPVAVCLLLALLIPVTLLSLPTASPYAIITVDINPSIELTVTADSTVLWAEALNDEGREILAKINLRQAKLAMWMRAIVEEAHSQSFLSEMVLITEAPAGPEKTSGEYGVSDLQEKARAAAEEVVRQRQIENCKVETVMVSSGVHKEAAESGLSDGKYAVYLTAKQSGVEVVISDLKDGSISKALRAAGAEPHEIIANAHATRTVRTEKEERERKGDDTRPGKGNEVNFQPPGQAKKGNEVNFQPPGQAKKGSNGNFQPPGQAKKGNGGDFELPGRANSKGNGNRGHSFRLSGEGGSVLNESGSSAVFRGRQDVKRWQYYFDRGRKTVISGPSRKK
ncbi:MAG: anti-sigma-I factor RsgI family protein [bacterium]|jgi:hypothetical protein